MLVLVNHVNQSLEARFRRRSIIAKTRKPVVYFGADKDGRPIWRWMASTGIMKSNDAVRAVQWCDRRNGFKAQRIG